jgi:hypothetical protein
MNRKFVISEAAALWTDVWSAFPIALSVCLAAFPQRNPYVGIGLLAGVYAAGMILRSLLIRKSRLPSVVLSLIACIGSGLLFSGSTAGGILFALLSLAVACRAILTTDLPFPTVFPRAYCFVSLLIYFLAYFLYGRIVVLRPYQSAVLYAGLIAVPTHLHWINSDVLKKASREELKDSSSLPAVKRNNRIITAVTLAIGLLLASYHTLKDAVLNALKSAYFFLLRIFRRIMSLLDTGNPGREPEGEGRAPQLPPAGPAKFSPFWDQAVRIIGYVLAFVLMAGFLIFLVRMLIRLLRRFARWIRRWLAEGSRQEETPDYRDEKESLLDWQAVRRSYADSIRDRMDRLFRREPGWDQLTGNRQRIRYLYRHLVQRSIRNGYEFHASRTPDETIRDLAGSGRLKKNLQSLLKRLYGTARYGNGTISDDEVHALKKDLME